MPSDITRQLFNRLRYIEGQAQGVRRMILGERPADEVMVQLRALESAAAGARELFLRHRIEAQAREDLRGIVETHLAGCPTGHDLRAWLAGEPEEALPAKRRRRKPAVEVPAEPEDREEGGSSLSS
ncbi:MAG: metal-sensing transcriptional repressor [Chloroflexota bacterium]